MWLLSISVPAVFSLSVEDPALIASMAGGEEEPGEEETKDSPEEMMAFPEFQRLHLITRAPAQRLPHITKVNRFQIIREIVLPPPEATPLPQSVS